MCMYFKKSNRAISALDAMESVVVTGPIYDL